MIYTPIPACLLKRRLLFMESCWNYVNYVCHSRMKMLIESARKFPLEKISSRLSPVHGTVGILSFL